MFCYLANLAYCFGVIVGVGAILGLKLLKIFSAQLVLCNYVEQVSGSFRKKIRVELCDDKTMINRSNILSVYCIKQ